MFKYSPATYVLAAYFVLICGLFGMCAVARADSLPKCEAYLQTALTAVAKKDAKVGVKGAKLKDGGEIAMVQLVNPTSGETYVFALTTTAEGVAILKNAGMTPGPQCQEEGQTWSSFSIRLTESI